MPPAGSATARSFEMKAKIAQYLNEIVSLTVMLLMVVALIDGQAGATLQDGPAIDAGTADEDSAILIQEPIAPAHDMDIDVLRLSIGMNIDEAAVQDLANQWSAALGEQLRLHRRLFARRHTMASRVDNEFCR
jgi:hypothetical protein